MSYNQNGGSGNGTIAQIPDRQGRPSTTNSQPTPAPSAYQYNMNAPVQSQVQQPQAHQQFNGQGQQGQGLNQNLYQQPVGYGYFNPQQQQQQHHQQQQQRLNYNPQSQMQVPQQTYAPQQGQPQPMTRPYGNVPQPPNQYPPPQQMPFNPNSNMYMHNGPNNGMQQPAPMSQPMPSTRKKVTLKLVILGNSGVGKTSLMHRYHSNKFTGQYKATIGADFLSKQLSLPSSSNPNSPPQKVTLTIWDTAGQERFQSLGKAFYRGSDSCILVYDVTDRNSFDELKKWKDEFDSCVSGNGGSGRGAGMMMNNRLYQGQPFGRNLGSMRFVVVANKADKEDAGRVVETKEGSAYAASIGGDFYECSAKTAMNVDEAFVAAAKAGLEFNNSKQMTASMMGGAGTSNMPGYVPPRRTVDLNRGNNKGGLQPDDCC